VSNFTLEWLRPIVEMGKVLPAVNQVSEPIPSPLACHPRLYSPFPSSGVHSERLSQIHVHPYNYASWKDVLEFSAKHGILTEAYGTLGCVPPLFPLITET
jgi:diketogulonate reductase-like aldo/keto reductase